MSHLHWPVPVESLTGECVAYICDECLEPCRPYFGTREYRGETWIVFHPLEINSTADGVMRNRSGEILKMLFD